MADELDYIAAEALAFNEDEYQHEAAPPGLLIMAIEILRDRLRIYEANAFERGLML